MVLWALSMITPCLVSEKIWEIKGGRNSQLDGIQMVESLTKLKINSTFSTT